MNQVLSLGTLAQVLRRRWFLVAFFVLLGPAFGFGVATGLPQTYEAQASLLVSAKGGSSQGPYTLAQFAEKRAATYPYLIDSPAVLKAIGDRLGLADDAGLARQISATHVLDTSLLQVNGSADTATGAADITNAAADGLVAYIGELEDGDSSAKVQVVVPARAPTAPAAPRRILYILVGLLLGAGVGTGVAVLLERRRLAHDADATASGSRLVDSPRGRRSP